MSHFATLVPMLLALAAACAQPPPPTGALPDPLAAGWQGRSVCELLRDDESLRVLRCTFPPGVGHERHAHAPHWGYALSGGRMRITDARGVREAEIESGSSFTSAGVPWHEVLNIGETTVAYLIVEPKSR